MKKRLVPTLALVGALHATSVVFEQLRWKSIVVATLTANFLGKLGICVAEHQAQSRLRVPNQAIQFVSEAFDVVHRVEYHDALLVDKSFNVRLE